MYAVWFGGKVRTKSSKAFCVRSGCALGCGRQRLTDLRAESWLGYQLGKMVKQSKISVCHIASGDLWAGAEAQIDTALEGLSHVRDLRIYGIVLNKGKLAERLKKHTEACIVLDETEQHFPEIVMKTIRFLKVNEIDVIHSHRYKENFLAGIAGVLCRIPVIRTQHGIGDSFSGVKALKMALYMAIDYFVGRYLTDRIVAVSGEMVAHLVKRFGNSKIVTIQNGIRMRDRRSRVERREFKRRLDIDEGCFLIGTAARLVPVKRIEMVVKAARILLDADMSNFRVLIIGDGPLKDELTCLASKLGVGKFCRFLGHREDALDIIEELDVYVNASVHEGLPMSLLEAQLLGIPVVAPKVGGIPELVIDGETGILVSLCNERSLAGAMLRLMQREMYRQKLGERARHNVVKRFSQEKNASALNALYQEVAKRSKMGGVHRPA